MATPYHSNQTQAKRLDTNKKASRVERLQLFSPSGGTVFSQRPGVALAHCCGLFVEDQHYDAAPMQIVGE